MSLFLGPNFFESVLQDLQSTQFLVLQLLAHLCCIFSGKGGGLAGLLIVARG